MEKTYCQDFEHLGEALTVETPGEGTAIEEELKSAAER